MNITENLDQSPKIRMSDKMSKKKLVMNVNTYVPHFYRIPNKIDKVQLAEFFQDYQILKEQSSEGGKFEEDESYTLVSEALRKFDSLFINKLISNREERFYRKFKQSGPDSESEDELKQTYTWSQSLSFDKKTA